MLTGQQPEGRAGVGNMHQVEKTGDNDTFPIERQAVHDPQLGKLIRQHHKKNQENRLNIASVQIDSQSKITITSPGSPDQANSATTLVQRLQSSG